MQFVPTPLAGAYVIEPERLSDDRGFFARTWCAREFAEHQLDPTLTQCNLSYNERRGTLRGMHYQLPPHGEMKLVRCTMGAVYDVIVDMRPESPTYYHWFATELSANNRRMLYIPRMFGHGFITLADRTEVFYQMSGSYHPPSGAGFRWNDPAIGIQWPEAPRVILARDAEWPLLPARI